MEAKIKAIHFDISDKLVNFINKKIDKLSRRFEAITEVEITLSEAGDFNEQGSRNKIARSSGSRSVRLKNCRHLRRSNRPVSGCTRTPT